MNYELQSQSAIQIPEYVAGKNIEDVKQKYKLKKVIKLASNENSYGVPKHIIKTLKKNLKNVFRYPDKEYKELKSKIAEKIGISEENIILGNGSDEIIDLVFKYKIKPSSKVIIFKPSYSMYKIFVKMYSVSPVEIKLENYEYNIDEIIKHLSNDIDLMILCNPNNPTGTYLSHNNLTRIVEVLNKNTLLLIDEAYFNYTTAPDFPNTVKIFKSFENIKNIIVTRTFSKIYSLAGLRISYGFGPKNLISFLNKIRMPFNINFLANVSALASLENDKFIEKCKIKNQQNKIFLYKELEKLNLKFIKSEANFILIELPQKAEIVFEKLLKKGIIVRTFYNDGMENYIRVTIGTKGELKKFLKELKKILK